MNPSTATRTLVQVIQAIVVISISAVATAALSRKWKRAALVSEAKSFVPDGSSLLLAIDIGSSSLRCSAYTVGSPPRLVPGCAVQIKHAILREDGTADANEVVRLVDRAVDQCFSELRSRKVSDAVKAVGFACFGMNLVGVDGEGRPCTPVFTYANSSSGSADVVKRLRGLVDKTGNGGKGGGGLEEARQRTGAPTHVSYAPPQLMQWLTTVTASAGRERVENEVPRSTGVAIPPCVAVKVWQTLPSLVAARWCGLKATPVSYSEASWMGLLDFRKLEWDAPTLSILQEAGFDCSTLPSLADVGELDANVSGFALEQWPELNGASIRLGLGDGAAACLGSGCDENSGLIAVTVGTSAAARVVLSMGSTAAVAPPKPGKNDVSAELFRVPSGLWCYRLDRHRAVLGGSLTDGGSIFEWLCDTLAVTPGNDLDSLIREAEDMPPASHGLVVLPFLSGERSPGYNDDARACILGLKRSTTRAQIVRAGLESVCLRLAAVVDLITGDGDGGGDRSEVGGEGYLSSASSNWLQPPPHTPSPYFGNKEADDFSTMASESRREYAKASSASGAMAGAETDGEAVATAILPWEHASVVTSGHAMAASPFWRQILADSLERKVQVSGATEETSLGVAIFLSSLEASGGPANAGVGGAWRSGAEARGSLTQKQGSVAGVVHTPSETSSKAYRDAGLAQKRAYLAIFDVGV